MKHIKSGESSEGIEFIDTNVKPIGPEPDETNTCACGDMFNKNYPGTCPNCIASMDFGPSRQDIMKVLLKHFGKREFHSKLQEVADEIKQL